MNRKTITALLALAASLGTLAVAAPAEAGTRTLTTGTYMTSVSRRTELGMPGWVPIAGPGSYRTTGRPVHRTCGVRGFGAYGATTVVATLVNARSYTVRIPADTWWIEVTGPCRWRRV